MHKKVSCLIIIFTFFNLSAQDNEIGIFAGGTNYIGDIGPTTYVNPFAYDGSRLKLLETIGTEPTFYALGILYRKNFNNRIAARIHFNHANIGSKDKLPKSASYRKLRDFEFVNTIQEFGIGIDFNFFEFVRHFWPILAAALGQTSTLMLGQNMDPGAGPKRGL